jgi:membrane protein implicated in regulation of membrane protease activity
MVGFDISFWHWWVLAIILFILEMMIPGAFFLWIGFGASVVGIIGAIAVVFQKSLGLEMQLLLFSIFSVLSVLLGRRVLKRHPVQTTHSTLNRRGEQYIGRTLNISAPIENGRGHVRLDDTLWTVQGPDCPANTQVRITGVEGSLLIVEVV